MARVDHLLLAKHRKLISSESVLVVLDEFIAFAIGSDGGVDGLDGFIVFGGLRRGRIASSVAGENLYEGDLALGWDIRGDFRGNAEEGRVLTPEVRDRGGARVACSDCVT